MFMKKIRIVTVVGTRPEIIRLTEIIKKLDKYFDQKLIYTGQNWHDNLSKVFFKDLSLRKPDLTFEVDRSSLSSQISSIINNVGIAIEKFKPEAFIVLGDTNSCLSMIPAKRKGIKCFHLEAGDRCFDKSNPEEINRRIVDHIADYNFAYTQNSKINLIKEGIHQDKIFVIGSPIKEVYEKLYNKINKSLILKEKKLIKKNYFIASIHREETVDKEKNFLDMIECFEVIAKKYKMPILISTHPRTKKKLTKRKIKSNKLIKWHEPFGLIDYLKLQINSLCTISDSGTIHEDSSILGFPAISLRNSTEKKEALENAHALLSGYDPKSILSCLDLTLNNSTDLEIPNDYNKNNVSTVVTKLILSLIKAEKKVNY